MTAPGLCTWCQVLPATHDDGQRCYLCVGVPLDTMQRLSTDSGRVDARTTILHTLDSLNVVRLNMHHDMREWDHMRQAGRLNETGMHSDDAYRRRLGTAEQLMVALGRVLVSAYQRYDQEF